MKSDTIIFLDEIGKIKARADNIIKDSEMLVNTLTEKEKFIPEILQYLDKYENLDERISKYQNVYLEKQDIAFNRPNMYRFTFKELNFYKSSIVFSLRFILFFLFLLLQYFSFFRPLYLSP